MQPLRQYMARRQHKVRTDVDASGVVGAFVFGLLVGVAFVYPALPAGLRSLDLSVFRIDAGGTALPMLLGVGLLGGFVLGVFVLNWLFIEAEN
jgi:hypothetical protein